MYWVGFWSFSNGNLSSVNCCKASEPSPPLHSATSIANPPFCIAFVQFQIEPKDLLKVSLLESFPVLIIIDFCFPIS